MNHDLYVFKRKLIEKKNRAAENARMNEKEMSFKPLLVLVIVLVVIAIFLGPR